MSESKLLRGDTMRIPTVEIKRPDGKIVRINETQLKYYIGRPGFTCDLRPKKESGGEPRVEQPQEATPVEDKLTDEKATTTLKRKMIIQPEPIKFKSVPADVQPGNLDDLLID